MRADDDQRLRWRTLPRSEGIRAVEVAGAYYYHREDLQCGDFDVGEELALVAEPYNREGTTSVAVKSSDGSRHIGYVPTDRSSPVFKMLQAGKDLRCFSMWEVREGNERKNLRVLIVEPDASIPLPGD